MTARGHWGMIKTPVRSSNNVSETRVEVKKLNKPIIVILNVTLYKAAELLVLYSQLSTQAGNIQS